jgi:hypothetical protein
LHIFTKPVSRLILFICLHTYTCKSQVCKTAWPFYLGFTTVRFKRRLLIANVSAGNITLCRGQYVDRKLRVNRTRYTRTHAAVYEATNRVHICSNTRLVATVCNPACNWLRHSAGRRSKVIYKLLHSFQEWIAYRCDSNNAMICLSPQHCN